MDSNNFSRSYFSLVGLYSLVIIANIFWECLYFSRSIVVDYHNEIMFPFLARKTNLLEKQLSGIV